MTIMTVMTLQLIPAMIPMTIDQSTDSVALLQLSIITDISAYYWCAGGTLCTQYFPGHVRIHVHPRPR